MDNYAMGGSIAIRCNDEPQNISKSIILGNNSNDYIINQILIVAKHEIYKNKWTKTTISLVRIQKVLKGQMELDIYIAIIKTLYLELSVNGLASTMH